MSNNRRNVEPVSGEPQGPLLIGGGTVLDSEGERRADVTVDRATGLVREVGESLSGGLVLDATGCYVSPGFVDLNTHLREPGNEAAETIESGSRAAALGGYTAVVAMPDTDPCLDSASGVAETVRSSEQALCEVVPAGAMSIGRRGEALAPMGELVDVGVRFFTDCGRGVQDDSFMRRALEYVDSIGSATGPRVVLAQRGERAGLSAGGVMNEGEVSARLGVGGQPAEAEELMVARDIALCRLTGGRVHFQCLSTRGSVALVAAAKAEGLAVTADVSPHHLALTDEDCAGYDPVFKVQPPLRTADDVAALKAGLADGTIDAIATDHSPRTADSKEMAFDQAPRGAIGLGTALGVALAELDLPVAEIVALLSWKPARIAGIDDRHGQPIRPGAVANLTVFDPGMPWLVGSGETGSKSTNSPFVGRMMRGRVRHTVFRGSPTVIDGEATR